MQALQSKYGGWANDQIVPAFANYARVVFKALGDRAEYWSTFNEPINFCFLHYAAGFSPVFIKDVVRLQVFLNDRGASIDLQDTVSVHGKSGYYRHALIRLPEHKRSTYFLWNEVQGFPILCAKCTRQPAIK